MKSSKSEAREEYDTGSFSAQNAEMQNQEQQVNRQGETTGENERNEGFQRGSAEKGKDTRREQYYITFQELFTSAKIYREVMDAIMGPPASTKKCHMIEIGWMRKFQAFGRACEKLIGQLTQFNVRF